MIHDIINAIPAQYTFLAGIVVGGILMNGLKNIQHAWGSRKTSRQIKAARAALG